jgi:8-oxo-dGTP pyrophosphatase MutT (NUDIX family)
VTPDRARSDVPRWLGALSDAAGQMRAPGLTGFEAPPGIRPRSASVLILFGESSSGPHVLLLQRASDLRAHAGQVAFPGGAQDADDLDPVATALREAQEETGLDPGGVQVLATLPALWLPPSNFTVTPVVAWWRSPSHVHPVDPAETASVHLVALSALLDPANRATIRHPSGHLGPAFLLGDLIVWGFTAGLLSRLFRVVGLEEPWDDTVVVDLPEPLVQSSLRDLHRAGGLR